MEVTIAEERILVLQDQLALEDAQRKASERKAEAFGAVSRLLLRPKPEEIEIAYSEKRFQPFWRASCKTRFAYDRSREFQVDVTGREVQSVTIGEGKYPVLKEKRSYISLRGVEHCLEEDRRELFLDAVTGKEGNWAKYVSFPSLPLTSMEDLATGGAIVVSPEVRASIVVRQLLSKLIRPVAGTDIKEESVEIDDLALFFRPIYGFEVHWVNKDKKGTIEIDGLTGEVAVENGALRRTLSRLTNVDFLFDVGADAVGLVVPGGSIAVKVVRAVIRKHQ